MLRTLLARHSGKIPGLVSTAGLGLQILNLIPPPPQSCQQIRCSTGCGLKEAMEEKIFSEQRRLSPFLKTNANIKIGEVTLQQIYGGMRGLPAMLCETSALDPNRGVMYRGFSIPEIRQKLPKAKNGEEPMPEAVFWLLCTGQIPSEKEVKALSAEWIDRGALPESLIKLMKTFPRDLHPMTQLAIASAALNHNSKFPEAIKKYNKANYWKAYYENSMDLIAKLPAIAAFIYRHSYCNNDTIPSLDKDICWTENFSRMLGWSDPLFTELLRLYLSIHCDHGSGNVSTHTALLVGSALSDPYLSFSAAMCGLAGQLHGLANQECLVWIKEMQLRYGENPTEVQVTAFVNETLSIGRVVPGYGHAVLRTTDPRFTCQAEFAKKHFPDDSLCKTVDTIYKVVPPLLQSLGKVQNPWPNVDAHSGALLSHFDMKEMQYYTVLFGVSRALGALPQVIWARAMGLPIERPNSFTPDELMYKVVMMKGSEGSEIQSANNKIKIEQEA